MFGWEDSYSEINGETMFSSSHKPHQTIAADFGVDLENKRNITNIKTRITIPNPIQINILGNPLFGSGGSIEGLIGCCGCGMFCGGIC